MNLKGVARFRCPVCGYLFLIWRGRKRNPKVKEIDEWLMKARCPKCGILIKAHIPNDRGKHKSIC